jgi:hypothetical protein
MASAEDASARSARPHLTDNPFDRFAGDPFAGFAGEPFGAGR